ncbi:MAG TPA: DUF2490 domain-containing protein [Flavihumibacter sp.]|nr:DUF2490 domain-containing protein [Flavihumibacter sp.]HPZ87186.1 DUF2490 domain-containing protein [Flavihumibacter sp.]
MKMISAAIKCLFLTGACIVLTVSTQAQTEHTGWGVFVYSVKLGKKTDLIGDIQGRTGDGFSHLQTLLLRGGLQVKLKPNLLATAGYAYIIPRRTINGISGYGQEHRLWQQLIFLHPIGTASIQHRLRLEQRFISKSVVEADALKNQGNFFANRIRYFVRGVQPLVTQKPFVKGPFLALQNEVMLQFGDKSGVNGKVFDQNRLYFAAGRRFSKQFDLEAGYMNQYLLGRGKAFTNNHIAQVAAYIRL